MADREKIFEALELIWNAGERPLLMAELKREYAKFAVAKTCGDITKASRKIAFGRSSMYRMLDRSTLRADAAAAVESAE